MPKMEALILTELESLPSDWRVQRLGEVCNIRTGKKDVNEGNPFGKYPFFTCSKDIHYSDSYSFNTEAIMVAGNGVVGETKYFRGKFEAYQRTYVLNQFSAFAPYLFLFLKGTLIADLKRHVTGSTMPYIRKGDLENIEIPIPPTREQRKIAGVLGVVQRALEQQERLIALTTELKKALLHQLFTQGLRGEPQKQTEIGPVPESWELRPLAQAGEVVYGIQAAVASNLKPVGTKILTNKNITLDGKIFLDAINYLVLKTKRHHETVLKKGDLLFNWRSGSKEHVGKTAYFDLDGECTHSSFILRIRSHDEVTGRYLFYFLNSLRASGYFVKSQTFSVNAKFNKSAVNRLPTYLPGEDERREIVTALDAIERKLTVLEAKQNLLTDLFRTLLHQLMTAQIRVHDLDFSMLGDAELCSERISERKTTEP